MKILKNSVLFLGVAVVMALASCCFVWEKELVTVMLPESSSSWILRYIDDSGIFCQREVPGGEGVECSVPKNSAIPFLALPCDKDGVPFGAIYPYSLSLCEDYYFPSDVLLTMYRSSSDSFEKTRYFLSCFDWGRFCEECKAFENPCELDKALIMRKISEGAFKKTDMRLKN